MRIGVACKFYSVGGVVDYNVRLAEALAYVGITTDLVFLRGAFPDWARTPDGARIVSYSTGARARLSSFLWSPIIKIMFSDTFPTESSPDLASWALSPLVHEWGTNYDGVVFSDDHFATFANLTRKLRPFRYIMEIHEGSLTLPPDRFEGLRRAAVRSARSLLTVSPAVENVIHRKYGRHAQVLFIARPTARIRLDKDPFFLLDTRWNSHRSPEFILDIMDLEPKCQYVMAGSFPSAALAREFQELVVRRGHANRLRLRLNLSDTAVDELYRCATAFLRWSGVNVGGHENGVAGGLWKALENGCPVILNKELGGAYFVQDGMSGLLVERTAGAFARAIDELAGDPSVTARMAAAAWRTADQHSIKETAPVLREIVSRAFEQ